MKLFFGMLLLVTAPLHASAPQLVQLRQPIALVASEDFQSLFVANRRSGTISIVDLERQQVVEEVSVGRTLSDLAALSPRHLLALDEDSNELILLEERAGRGWRVGARLTVPAAPVRIAVDREVQRCYISSLWSRTVCCVDLSLAVTEAKLKLVGKQRLAFEPRELCLLREEQRLVVAASFDARLAALSTAGLAVVNQLDIPGHNIRGLVADSDDGRLWLAQQELNPIAHSTRDDVHWGNVVSNLLVSLDLGRVLGREPYTLRDRTVWHLGNPGRGAADPGGLFVSADKRMAVLLSGVHEIGLAPSTPRGRLQRVRVGQTPSDVIELSESRLAVADRFSDSISIVDRESAKLVDQISLGTAPSLTPAEVGERLFFDAELSHDGWMSCHSCHTDGHGNSQLNDNLSDGSFGAPKRVLSLLGVSETAPWAWNGGVEKLHDQVVKSIEVTMQGETPVEEDVESLVAFMETLSIPSVSASLAVSDPSEIRTRGQHLFQALECARCHSPPTFTTPDTYDVGLEDAVGNRRFNPPSLRGVGRRSVLFHDGRASSLRDVVMNYKHQLPRELTSTEVEQLLFFLGSI